MVETTPHAPARSAVLQAMGAAVRRPGTTVDELLSLLVEHQSPAGLHRAVVYTVGDGARLQPRHRALTPGVTAPLEEDVDGDRAVAQRCHHGVPRQGRGAPAGPQPAVPTVHGPSSGTGSRTAVALNSAGHHLGVLLLAGPTGLPDDVLDAVSLHLTWALERESTARDAAFASSSASAVRHLLEQGSRARSVREAGEVLARVAASAFRADRAGVYITDAGGRITEVVGVGIEPSLCEALVQSLVGKLARESPVWQSTERVAGPVLVRDADRSARRPGGFVQTLDVRSYVAVPLLSEDGPLGLVICGDHERTRTWTAAEAELARQLALEGALVVDAARLRAAERSQLVELTYQAFHDELTGLPNRALLVERAAQALQTAGQRGGGVALLLLDLDDFKQVNDTLGHPCGDVLLQKVAGRLVQLQPEVDTVARLGGDEFAVLVTGPDAEAAAWRVAARVEQLLATPVDLGELSLQVAASTGIARFPQDAGGVDALLQRADVAMYAAKRSSVPTRAYDGAHDRRSLDRLAVYTELHQALAADELTLHYQPKVDLRTGRVCGVEALVRWQHPRRGLLGPGEFLPVAEATGLMHPLTRWVLVHAVTQWQQWVAAGRRVDLAVNVSVRDLRDDGFRRWLVELLATTGVARSLVLEVTETAVMEDPVQAAQLLSAVRTLGVRVSMDDFGAGYSSLSQLRQLPVDELKVDRELVRGVGADLADAAVVRAVVELGHHLGLRVVAEGVEDDAALQVLRGLGCDQAQGYLLGRPAPPDRVDWRTGAAAWYALPGLLPPS